MSFDARKVAAEAQEELAQERAAEAKTKIKAKLRQIAAAKAVVSNLEEEYQVLLRDIAG